MVNAMMLGSLLHSLFHRLLSSPEQLAEEKRHKDEINAGRVAQDPHASLRAWLMLSAIFATIVAVRLFFIW
jgi:hypothetical protein